MKESILKACSGLITPAYIFDETEFCERVELIKDAFSGINLCYSIKANPFLLHVLPNAFSKLEVCSPGELEICKALGVDPEMIIFSGLNKSIEEIKTAVDYGVRTLTAESRSHLLDEIKVAAEMEGGTACELDVLLRLADDSQFGIDRDELINLVNETKKAREGILNISGLHYFTGTGKRKSREIERELELLTEYIEEFEAKTGVRVEKIEYGTGMGVQYFDGSEEELLKAELSLMNEVADALRKFKDRTQVELTVEMGRFFTAPCGHYVTRIVDAKTNNGTNYLIVDGGSHQIHYDGQMQGMKLPLITIINANGELAGGAKTYTIAGSLCTTADVLARTASFDSAELGDRLVFHKTGAYSVCEGMSLFLSRDIPRVYILCDDGAVKLIRDRIETAQFNI